MRYRAATRRGKGKGLSTMKILIAVTLILGLGLFASEPPIAAAGLNGLGDGAKASAQKSNGKLTGKPKTLKKRAKG